MYRKQNFIFEFILIYDFKHYVPDQQKLKHWKLVKVEIENIRNLKKIRRTIWIPYKGVISSEYIFYLLSPKNPSPVGINWLAPSRG